MFTFFFTILPFFLQFWQFLQLKIIELLWTWRHFESDHWEPQVITTLDSICNSCGVCTIAVVLHIWGYSKLTQRPLQDQTSGQQDGLDSLPQSLTTKVIKIAGALFPTPTCVYFWTNKVENLYPLHCLAATENTKVKLWTECSRIFSEIHMTF